MNEPKTNARMTIAPVAPISVSVSTLDPPRSEPVSSPKPVRPTVVPDGRCAPWAKVSAAEGPSGLSKKSPEVGGYTRTKVVRWSALTSTELAALA